MSLRLVAGSTLWQLASQLAMAALSILTVKFVAIGLTKELAGNYNTAYGYLQLFGILADFGLYAVAVHEVSKAKDRGTVLGALLTLRSITLTGSLIIALLLAWSMPMWKETPLPLAILIAALVPFFTLLAGMMRVVFQVTYRMHWVFVAEVTQRVITVLLIGFFIAVGIRGSSDLHIFHLFLFAGGIGAFVLFLISFVAGSRLLAIRPVWNTQLLADLFRRAFPYGIAFLCMALYRQFDVTMIALLRPDFEIQNAHYGFAARMIEMGFLIPTFLLNSALPLLGERDEKGQARVLGAVLTAILAVCITGALCAWLWATPLMQLLTTEAYLETPVRSGADTALRILSLSLFCNGIVLYGFYVLLARHAWRRLVAVMAAGALASILLNLMLIPSHGFVGAAWTSVFVHMLLAVALLIACHTVIRVRLGTGTLLRLAIYALLVAGALMFLRPLLQSTLATLVCLIIMAIVLPLLLWATGLLQRFVRPAAGL